MVFMVLHLGGTVMLMHRVPTCMLGARAKAAFPCLVSWPAIVMLGLLAFRACPPSSRGACRTGTVMLVLLWAMAMFGVLAAMAMLQVSL